MDHVTVSLSEDGGQFAFRRVRDAFEINIDPGDWIKIGPLRLRLSGAKGHLENGDFRIEQIGGVDKPQVKELDLVWDRFLVGIGLDVPKVCVGGFCLIPTVWGCALDLPKKCFFASDPDISATLDLAGLRHEISSAFEIVSRNESDHWSLVLMPQMPLDIDVLDPAGIVGAAFGRLIKDLVRDLTGHLPDWAVDLIEAILGAFSELIEVLLDLEDDLLEWISEKIGMSLGVLNMIISLLLEFFYDGEPISKFENPYVLAKAEADLPAVTIPIKDVTSRVFADRIEFGLSFGS